jgi:sarcosine oxidase subunit alpha
MPAPPVPMIGRVTSSYFSPTLGRSIALGLLDGGLKRMGETVTVALPDRPVRAVVGKSRFYDLEGERLHG